jgi:fatty acid desaturase
MVWKLLSPVAILVGLIGAAGCSAYFWPSGPYFVPIALGTFTLVAGICELILRLLSRKKPSAGKGDA